MSSERGRFRALSKIARASLVRMERQLFRPGFEHYPNPAVTKSLMDQSNSPSTTP